MHCMYEAKMEFPGGEGGAQQQQKKPSMGGGGVWIFSGTAHYKCMERHLHHLAEDTFSQDKLKLCIFFILLWYINSTVHVHCSLV